MSEFTLRVTVADGENTIFPNATRITVVENLMAWAERNGHTVTITEDHSEEAIGELCGVIDSAAGFLMSKARRDPIERQVVSDLVEVLRKYSPPSEE